MNRPLGIALVLVLAVLFPVAVWLAAAAPAEGTLTVAVATFGNERWLPNLYVGAEDVVLKPLFENLLTRDVKTGELSPMLAERWQVLDGEFIERLAVQPNPQERTRIMRDEMGPWLQEYVPGVPIGAAHAIAGVGPTVGEWPLIPGHMGFHNWEYVTRAR